MALPGSVRTVAELKIQAHIDSIFGYEPKHGDGSLEWLEIRSKAVDLKERIEECLDRVEARKRELGFMFRYTPGYGYIDYPLFIVKICLKSISDDLAAEPDSEDIGLKQTLGDSLRNNTNTAEYYVGEIYAIIGALPSLSDRIKGVGKEIVRAVAEYAKNVRKLPSPTRP